MRLFAPSTSDLEIVAGAGKRDSKTQSNFRQQLLEEHQRPPTSSVLTGMNNIEPCDFDFYFTKQSVGISRLIWIYLVLSI